MIAQILLSNRRGGPVAGRPCEVGESRSLDFGARCVRVGLAVLLAPALLAMLVIGGLGASAVWLAVTVAGPPGLAGGRRRPD